MRIRRKSAMIMAASSVSVLAVLGGSYATFTASAAAPAQQISTTTATIAVQSTTGTTWTSSISNLAAGDTDIQYLNLLNTGTTAFSSVTLGQTNLGTALAGTNGLAVSFDGCSVAWSSTNTCTGTQINGLLPSTALVNFTAPVTLLNGTADFTLGASTTEYLRENVVLNQAAPNTDQGLTEKVSYTFTGNQ